jgi:methanogenic corrinoid protein MtbC1
MLADLLREAGYRVVDLGANTPAASFVGAARDADRLVAVCIGSTTEGLDDSVEHTVAALHQASIAAPILAGGAAVVDAEAATALGADGWTGLDAISVLAVIERNLADARSSSSRAPIERKG